MYRGNDVENNQVQQAFIDYWLAPLFHNYQPWCATKLKDDLTLAGNVASWGFCSTDCPRDIWAWKADSTMKVTNHYNGTEKMVALNLYVIISFSLLLIGLMVTVAFLTV